MRECEDCGEECKRRRRCNRCGKLVCAWCSHHVHELAQAADSLVSKSAEEGIDEARTE